MAHRGPDGEGFHFGPNVALASRRLSIIDLPGGQMPIYNEDGSIVVVFNGEIYNYKELRSALVAKGHVFKTNSDTEVIVHGYEEWGIDAVKQFNGMFGFAVWDTKKSLMWVARDRFGVKPLYYYEDKSVFVCASEIKPMLETGLVKTSLNTAVLDAYFTLGYVLGPETMFKGIRKLQPGHSLVIQDGGLRDVTYWDFDDVAINTKISFSEARDQTEELLKDSVKKCLISDVPVGVFLSGGLDSSAILALMSELGCSTIDAFTVDYELEGEEGETAYASLVAKKYNARHHVFRLHPENFFESIQTLVRNCEEPLVEAASIALYHLSTLAGKHVKVLLSGEGSDEIFGGYSLYHSMLRMSRIQQFIPPGLWRKVAPLCRHLPQVRVRKYIDWLSLPLEARYQSTSGFLTESLKQDFYDPAFYRSKGDYLTNTFREHFRKVSRHNSEPLSKLLYVDSKTWLADDILLKADKMTMAASVELRVPFLDHRLAELAASFPAEFKYSNGRGKYVLRSIMEAKLPPKIIDRKKMGFPVPIKRWFGTNLRNVIRERLVDGHRLPWISSTMIHRTLDEHEKHSQDHSKWILSLLVLSYWLEEFEEYFA